MTTIIDGSAGITYPNSTVQASAGVVLQVVNATYSTSVSNATSTVVDTGLTATITPKFATSKILVLVSQNGCGKQSSNTNIRIYLYRGASSLYTVEDGAAFTGDSSANYIGSISTSYLDSPATTSATTYKTGFSSSGNTGTVYLQNANSTSTITLMEIAG